MVTSSKPSAAINWLDAPNNWYRYTNVLVSTRKNVSAIEKMVETLAFLNTGIMSPTHSVSVTRMTRNSNWVTVRTMTTKVPYPIAVPYGTEPAPKITPI